MSVTQKKDNMEDETIYCGGEYKTIVEPIKGDSDETKENEEENPND